MHTLLQINTTVNSGSTGRIAEEIGQIVIQNGWKSYIAYGRNKRPSYSNLIKIGTEMDMKCHGLQTRLFDRHGLGSRNATKKLINEINKIKPDIIHLHNLHGYYLNISILFKYFETLAIPIIWTFHDCWPMTGHCVHFDSIDCDKWKTECCNCPQKNTYPASYLIDRSSKNYFLKKELFTSLKNLTIITVSNWLESIVKQSFFSSIPIYTIYNGVDMEIFTPIKNSNIKEKYNLGTKFIILGVANVWSPGKGLNDFIELSKVIDINTAIILVGLTNRQIKNLPVNIVGISKTENTLELAELYSAANIFVNTSVEETFGLATAESLSCGTPAVVYNATACPEVIDNNTGFIVRKFNIEGILQAVETVKKNGKEKYSNNCIKRIKEDFNKIDRYHDYLKLYDKLLSQGKFA